MNELLVYRPMARPVSALVDVGLALEAEQKLREAVARSCPDCTRLWSSVSSNFWRAALRKFRGLPDSELEIQCP